MINHEIKQGNVTINNHLIIVGNKIKAISVGGGRFK